MQVSTRGYPFYSRTQVIIGCRQKPRFATGSCGLVASWSPPHCASMYVTPGNFLPPIPVEAFPRLKEHQDACRTQSLQKSVVAEHAWGSHHPINWKDTSVIDRARRPEELLLAIHIQGTPAGERLNRDGGKEIPRCWTAALKRSEGAANSRPNRNFRRQIAASGDTQWLVCGYKQVFRV